MATITTYTTLQSTIADYLNRADLTAQIPTFIQMAEADMNTRLRTREMIVRAEATSSNEYVQLPSDWVEAINLHIVDGKQPLRFVTLDEADRIIKQNIYTQVAAFSLMNGALELVPPPGSDVDIEMIYYGKIPTLSAQQATNWLLTKAPDVYLYGSLLHAQPFLMDDQRMPVFATLYNSRIEALNEESMKSTHSGSPLIARARRVY
jgi:hypothetical protein